MTNYARIRIVPEVSASSDYRSKLAELAEIEYENATPTKHMSCTVLPPTTGLIIDLNAFTTVLGIVLVNRSTTAAQVVDAMWWHQKWTAAGNVDIAQAVTGDTITDNGASFASFVTLGAIAGDWVRVSDAATAGNNAAWQLRTVAADILTCVVEATLTATGAPDAVTLSGERRNTQGVPPNDGLLVVTDNVVPIGDLLLTSESGTPTVDVFIFGT